MDAQRLKKRRPADPYPELEDDSWQPPATEADDPVTTTLKVERHRALNRALSQITTTSEPRSSCSTWRASTMPRSPIMTGVSLGTVKSRIHRGRLALRDRLAGQMDLFRG